MRGVLEGYENEEAAATAWRLSQRSKRRLPSFYSSDDAAIIRSETVPFAFSLHESVRPAGWCSLSAFSSMYRGVEQREREVDLLHCGTSEGASM